MPRRETIRVSPADTRERKRRQREIWLAIFGIFFITFLSWIELKYIGTGSYSFLILFNFNFVLLLVILFVVGRNIIKLILERRRRVLGSKIRTRLVIAFMSLSLIPTLLMFVLSVNFVRTSVDYWFKAQVENSMEQALEVGQDFYSLAQSRLEKLGGSLLEDIIGRQFAWGGKTMDVFLEEKGQQHDLGIIGVLTPDMKEQNWHTKKDWEFVWPVVQSRIDWKKIHEKDGVWSDLMSVSGMDVVLSVIPVDSGKTGYLVLCDSIGSGLLDKLDQIVRGLDEYKKLKTLKYPLKVALYLTLGLITMSIILGSMWFGFRLAKEISAPVQALAIGTQRIARGDLSVRLMDQSTDELGFLVQSFNRMAEDLEEGQARLKKANRRLNQQNRELEGRRAYIEAVLDNITAGVVSIDAVGRISTVNKAAETMLGLEAHEVRGKSPVTLLHGEYADLIQDVGVQLAKSPDMHWQQQLELPIGSRQMKFLVNAVALRTPDGQPAGLVAVFEDITELEKMQRLAAWREVARRIAHEIKNPLTPIKLSAQRLERKFASEIEDRVFLECTTLIVRQVEHMQEMVKEFSSFAKLPEVVLRPGDFASLLEEVVGVFKHSHRHIGWSLRIDGELPRISFDREAVRRVLINLFTNAADVMEGQDDAKVEVEASYDRILDLVRIEVRDNGPGMTDEERSRLFEPYFSRRKGGTGLGLTIAKSIVSDHHGYIRVRPNSPVGSIFVVEIPAGK